MFMSAPAGKSHVILDSGIFRRLGLHHRFIGSWATPSPRAMVRGFGLLAIRRCRQ